MARSRFFAIPSTGVNARQTGADRTVREGSDTGWAAQDGVAWAVAGRAVRDGCHIWLPVSDGSREDWTIDWAVRNRRGARLFAGAGYIESPRASWLADGRCRRPRATAEWLAGGRWAGNRLTAAGPAALDYIAGRLTWTRHTDTCGTGTTLRADGLADAGDATRRLLASAGDTRWLTGAWNTANRAKTDRLTDQSHTGSWLAVAGL